jgi:hypothetical protein
MTSQTKYFIDVSDIIALRFECKHCHATTSLPISSDIRIESLRACPNCNEPWARMNESSIEIAIKKFVDNFKEFEAVLRRRNEFAPDRGFILSVEIRAVAVETANA